MTAQERLDAFKRALAEAGAEFGVRLAIIQQIGAVVLDEPALGYVLVDTPDESIDSFPVTSLSQNALPLSAGGEGVGGEV
jgi:hypothetical protein